MGTFIHGLGNYKAMRSDPELPFSEKIKRNASHGFRSSYQAFVVAASAARQVFDDALEAGRMKAELEVQAAVAAAAKAASKREEDAALLREGGDGVEDVIRNMPETQVENAFEFDGTDSHFVTLPRLHGRVREALAKKADEVLRPDIIPEEFTEGTIGRPRAEGGTGRPRTQMMLSMPDSRLLDHRLLEILAAVEKSGEGANAQSNEPTWHDSSDSYGINKLRRNVLSRFHGESLNYYLREYAGVGLAGAQCGTTHRTLNDGTDFGYGSASPPLSQVAYGTDAPRYLRALGIPMNVTRFAVSALSYADKKCMDQLLALERRRFYTEKDTESEKMSDTEKSQDLDQNQITKTSEDGTVSTNDALSPKLKEGSKLGGPAPAAKSLELSLLIPVTFRTDAKVRAVICLGVLMFGFPKESVESSSVNPDVLALTGSRTSEASPFFDKFRFRDEILSFCGGLDLPDAQSIAEYVESSLLPHCLRLCLYGNGPTTRDARGSQGEYETALGVSLHPAPSTESPCPLPDPCVDLKKHSLESLGVANAILRRTQMLRASQFICSGSISAEELTDASKSKVMSSPENLPVWWCPWVHDVALLARASSNGLLAVMQDRGDDSVFSEHAIAEFLRTSLENQPFPFADHLSSPELLNEWIRYEAKKFPSLLQVERRLAFLCSKVTANAENLDDRFVVLPMFDHGGWPRD